MKSVGRFATFAFFALVCPAITGQSSAGATATTRPAAELPDPDRATLTTKHFAITIIDHRDDPTDITSDHVLYIGVSKRNGKSIRLVGGTFHHLDADGTPQGFQGYIFFNGRISYRVYHDGTLEIRRDGDEILLSEAGTWNH